MADGVAHLAALDLRKKLTDLPDVVETAALATVRQRLAQNLEEIFEPCCQLERTVARLLPKKRPTGKKASADDVLKHFPVARRLVEQLINDWMVSTQTFAARWVADSGMLGNPGNVLSFGSETSDPHDGGQRVLVAQAENGRKIVYKPRGLGMEREFQQLLAEINAKGFPWLLRTVDVIDRGEYGWMEYVRAQPCFSRRQTQWYYLRAGALACLFHVLDGVDGHTDNVIPAGEQPVIIDLETLLHPPGKLGASVLATGLLPVPQMPEYTIPAFGRPRPGRPERFVEEIAEGFRVMAECLNNRIDIASWVERFSNQPRRLVLRTTDDYLKLRKKLLSPWLLSDETARRDYILRACEGVVWNGIQVDHSSGEVEALDRLDIPRVGSEGSIVSKDGNRLLDPKRIEQQVASIRIAFSK